MARRRYEPDPAMEVLSRMHGTMSVLDAQHREGIHERMAERSVPVEQIGQVCDVLQAAAVLLNMDMPLVCVPNEWKQSIGVDGLTAAVAALDETRGGGYDYAASDEQLAVATALVNAANAVLRRSWEKG